jgi:hypothetical protein
LNKEQVWNYTTALAERLLERKTVNYFDCKALYKDMCGYLHFNKGIRSVNINKKPLVWPTKFK